MELAQILSSLRLSTASVGLDLGQRIVKCVQLSKKGKKIYLNNFFMLDLAKSNDDFLNNSQLVTKLAAAVEVNGFTKSKITMSGNNRHVQMLDFNLPLMPAKELRMVIESNLQDTLKRPIAEITFDHVAIPENENQIVRVYFSEAQDVIESVEAVRKTQLKPLEMNASFLATAEMLQFNEYTEPNKAYILIDQGERSTRISLLLGHEVIASNCHPDGMGLINSNLISQQQLTYEQAEVAKMQILSRNEVVDESLRAIVDDSYSELVESIRNTIDFYLEQELGVNVKEILLTGGGSCFGSLSQLLSTHYKLPVVQINPFRNIDVSNCVISDPLLIASSAPFMAAAVGLALGRIDW